MEDFASKEAFRDRCWKEIGRKAGCGVRNGSEQSTEWKWPQSNVRHKDFCPSVRPSILRLSVTLTIQGGTGELCFKINNVKLQK